MEKDKKLAQVFHYDLYGKRTEKYDFLLNNNLQTVQWRELELTEPLYFFVEKDFSLQGEYNSGFSVQELFPVNSVGIVTARDNFTIHDTAQAVKNTINEFMKLDVEAARNRFNLGEDVRDWSVAGAKKDLTSNPDFSKIVEINYRPFDKRFTYYTGNSKGFHCMPRGNVMQHFLKGENVGLLIGRQGQVVGSMLWNLVFVTKQIVDFNLYYRGGGMVFPLYLYPESDKLFSDKKRKPNLKEEIIDDISQRIGARFTEEKEDTENTFAPIDVLDYIYAILHSPAYRERYKEFLKIDFPRVPYPENSEKFWALAALGGKLRRLHLMEGVEPQNGLADFPVIGSCEVEKLQYISARHCGLDPQSQEKRDCQEIAGQARNDGRVYINDKQYFDHVPPEAWNFYIGGYQPAQKWLKDRKGRMLGYDDIWHYQRIIRVLWETGEVMREVDETLE